MDKQNVEFGIEAQKNTQLNEEQLNEIAHHVAMISLDPEMTTKTRIYDYLEEHTSSKRIAIITAMYLGYRSR